MYLDEGESTAMTPRHLRFRRAFTLLELTLLFVVFFVLAAVLYSIFAHQNTKVPRSSCASQIKQIGLALLGYTQDYDEKLPPLTGMIRCDDGSLREQQWGLSTTVTVNGKVITIPSLIAPFVRNHTIFKCPSAQQSKSGLTYMYNDLAAKESLSDIAQPGYSLMTTEGDDHLRNVGHARSQSSEGDEAAFQKTRDGRMQSMVVGAAIGDAITRHRGGGNYGFADGHVKWIKPDAVFFPPRTSNSSSHCETKTGNLLGPDPAGATHNGLSFQGKNYSATFHIR
jgi:prepilin-type processing-associated H-X9-DG protein